MDEGHHRGAGHSPALQGLQGTLCRVLSALGMSAATFLISAGNPQALFLPPGWCPGDQTSLCLNTALGVPFKQGGGQTPLVVWAVLSR